MNENQEPNNEWKTVDGPGPENPKKKGKKHFCNCK